MQQKEIDLGYVKYYILKYVEANLDKKEPVSEISQNLNMTYKSTLKHLKDLKNCDIIQMESDGKKHIISCVNPIEEWKVEKREARNTWYQ